MTAKYYDQWDDLDESEVDLDNDTDLDHDNDDTDLEQNEGCCSGGCMDCLGFSWKDFF